MEIALVNPRKRRKARRVKKSRRSPARRRRAKRVAAKVAPRRRRAVRRYRVRGFKRNPTGALTAGGVMASVKNGALAASGALALDLVMGFLPIPDRMKVGPVGIATKAAGAVGLGYLAGRFLGRTTGVAVTEGALTILAYNVMKPQVARFLPQIALGEYVNGLGEYVDGLGEYVNGYTNPAPIIGYDGGNSGFGEAYPITMNAGVPSGFGEYDDNDPFGLEG